jgi:hypothetical protein
MGIKELYISKKNKQKQDQNQNLSKNKKQKQRHQEPLRPPVGRSRKHQKSSRKGSTSQRSKPTNASGSSCIGIETHFRIILRLENAVVGWGFVLNRFAVDL